MTANVAKERGFRVRLFKLGLFWALVALALIGCQRALATPTTAPPPPTPTKIVPSPTPVEVAPTPTPQPLIDESDEQTQYAVAPGVPRITPSELKSLLSSARNVIVIDTRGHDAYEAAHIRGALDIPYDQVEFVAPQLSRSAKLIFYCA
jgi:hypothetical protein